MPPYDSSVEKSIFLDTEARQRALFDALADDYEAHYDDSASQRFRDRFIHGPLYGNLPLEGARVLDAMCGSGETTRFLVDQGAIVDGLDISGKCIERYRQRWPSCRAHNASILKTGLPDQMYDLVVIVGGLHHLHPHVDQAMEEIYRILKPGGCLCFAEPHQGSLADVARRFWYRHDPIFEDNEAAIDIEGLKQRHSGKYQLLSKEYMGNLAYLLVLNSMIFRVPRWFKRLYAPALLRLEWLTGPIQGRRLSCVAICRWRRRSRSERS